MKARIEKKLSKKVTQLAPKMFKDAWVDTYYISELAYEQGSRVRRVLYMGGGTDYWGEANEAYTAWEWFLDSYMWQGHFKPYPTGHEFEDYPNTDEFKKTTINLLRFAKEHCA